MSDECPLDEVIRIHQVSGAIPTQLVANLWSDPATQSELVAMLVENLQKSGSLGKVAFWMAALAASLPCSAAVELYLALRDRSLRCELEWRHEFQTWFGHCREQLPPVALEAIRPERLADYLIGAVEANDLEDVTLICECMVRVGLNPADTRVLALEDLGLSGDELADMSAEQLRAWIEDRRRYSGVPIVDYASRLGHQQLIPRLQGS
jgi:hypothetical protein